MNKLFSIIILTTFIFLTSILFIFKKPTIKDNEVVFWTLQMSDFAPYINGVIDEFEAQNPNVKIKWVDVPFSEGEKRTLASVLSDNPPDLVNLNPDFSATLAHKGALFEISQDKLEQFNPSILGSLKYNEKIYSIPWYATSAVTIYNKELFNKAGVNVPKTYSQLVDFAPIVKRNSGAFIILPNITENDTMLKILNKYGVATSTLLSSEKSVEVFGMFKYLYSNNLIPKETVTMTLQESLEKYMSGNIALIGAGANFLNMIRENAPSTYAKTDVAPQIVGDLGQNDFSLMNFVIPLRAKHKEEALAFALFLTNEKNQLELAKLTNVLAVNKNTLNDEFYTKYDKNDLMAKARVISAKQLDKIQPVYRTQKSQKDINNILNSATQEILLDKGSIQEILDKASKDWKDIEE
ncbi:sugar ABC transporter substrate-binding protein [bacterium]|nr:sugar ABC transporter substrate-binding protein [bacterium]MBO5446531.1 sugar ABC transporter substrate-binding protein [bacterium]